MSVGKQTRRKKVMDGDQEINNKGLISPMLWKGNYEVKNKMKVIHILNQFDLLISSLSKN